MPSPIPFTLQDLLSTKETDAQALTTSSTRAKNHLRHKCKKEKKVHFTVPGNIKLTSGQTVSVSGFGVFDEVKWIIERARHVVGKDGFVTEIDLRHCQDPEGVSAPAEKTATENDPDPDPEETDDSIE